MLALMLTNSVSSCAYLGPGPSSGRKDIQTEAEVLMWVMYVCSDRRTLRRDVASRGTTGEKGSCCYSTEYSTFCTYGVRKTYVT